MYAVRFVRSIFSYRTGLPVCINVIVYEGNMQSANFTPEDVFWGELGGGLEALDAGTTSLVDYAYMSYYSSDAASNGIAATVSSGIRPMFCYTPTVRVKS
jgi:hypothetical protein